MTARPWYPIFLDIVDQTVVVVGGGPVALRKARGALEAGARVTVVSPKFDAGFDNLPVLRVEREFEDSDLDGAVLVFAATNVRDVNRRVGQLARRRRIPANIADAPEECGFLVPARIFRENLQIAISTGGENPSRAAAIRRKLEEWLDLVRP